MYFKAQKSEQCRQVSLIVTIFLLVVAAYGPLAMQDDLPMWLWLIPTVIPILILVLAWLFSVRGYRVDDETLYIVRPFWSTEIPRADFREYEVVEDILTDARRVYANAGLFSYVGVYDTDAYGEVSAYVTHLYNLVLIHAGEEQYLLSPDDVPSMMAALSSDELPEEKPGDEKILESD